MQTSVIAPIIHGNGTSAESLKEALSNAFDAINAALDKLRQCAPNGRDYYLEPGRLWLAEGQHVNRQNALLNLMNELESEMEAIDQQTK